MTTKCFDVTVEDGVAHIVLCRPEKRNSMIPEFWDQLPEIIHDLDDNARARAIVISSMGPHFSSGLDVTAFDPAGGGANAAEAGEPDEAARRRARRTKGASFYDSVRRMQETFTCLEQCRIPVLAAVQGGAIGGGVDLSTACDMRYATRDAFFTIYETNIAMTADVGTFPRLVKLIPEGIVRELAYTGRRMPAEEAKEVGLVNQVFDDQEAMLGGVMEIAKEIASKAPLAVYGCKRMINYARDHSTADALDYIGIWNASFLQPDEMAEAMAARMQKRPADFVDLPPRKARTADDEVL